jgi:hypothetical protein
VGVGVDLELTGEGEFTWNQKDVERKGWFAVEDGGLIMTVESGYETRYVLLELTEERLVLRDPEGTRVVFESLSGPGQAGHGGAVHGPDGGTVAGVWENPKYQLRIELSEEGRFVWKQGSLVETGTYEVEEDVLRMSTGGHTSLYRIASLEEDAFVIIDPAGNTLELERSEQTAPAPAGSHVDKESLMGGKPTIEIIDVEGGDEPRATDYELSALGPGQQVPPPADSVVGPGELFYFVPPDGFKVDTQKVCGNKFTSQGKVYTCWNRNDLYSPDSSRLHFEIASFATWAAPGALDVLTPDIDALLASFDTDVTSVSDEIWQMAGFEIFSTRLGGLSSGSGKRMQGRLIGIHYGDLLIVGVLALIADPAVMEEWQEQVRDTLDSLAFHIVEGEETGEELVGTWKADDGTVLEISADGSFETDGVQGSWIVLGRTLVLASGPPVEGTIEFHPVLVQGSSLNLGGVLYERP